MLSHDGGMKTHREKDRGGEKERMEVKCKGTERS